jgi:hypothetical protein
VGEAIGWLSDAEGGELPFVPANGVLNALDLDMPMIDLNSLRQMLQAPRCPMSIPPRGGPEAGSSRAT